ncbi:uncharacterized protein TNCV_287711 [Trichonephila clavipes]|nr:uncharacterized protein TNCV_287711 [Trichonephila clavipes]
MDLNGDVEWNILNRHRTSRARFCLLLPAGTFNNGPSACLFLEESISERRGKWILGNPSPLLCQAVTPFASGLRRLQLVPEQHLPQGVGLKPLNRKRCMNSRLTTGVLWGTLNSRRAASPLVWLEGEARWEAPDHPQGFLPLNWGGTEQKRTVTCMVLKAKANDRRKF